MSNSVCKYSDGVSSSCGVSFSDGVSSSRGVSSSYGVSFSRGVYNSMFVSNYRANPLLFNKEVSTERIEKVKNDYNKLSNGWFPKFNNAFELYKENGEKWNFDASKIKSKTKKEAWSDMPIELLKYIRSLPEFCPKIFKEITGIKHNTHKIIIDGKEIELSEESFNAFKAQFE